jgi:hypothetical protein
MFIGERALLIGMTLHACGVCTCSQSRLLKFKPSMWIVAITALHRPFEDLVVKRHVELVLGLRMTAHAKLRIAFLEHCQRSGARLLIGE